METDNTQKGIHFDATFAQFLSAVVLVFLLFVLPVGGYELAKDQFSQKDEVYTVTSLRQNDVSVDGRVAGISTTSSANNESITDQLATVSSSKYLLIGFGVVLVLISTALSAGLIYDFLKK